MHMYDVMHMILSGACLCVCEWYCSRYLILLRDCGLSICTDFQSELNENYDNESIINNNDDDDGRQIQQQ